MEMDAKYTVKVDMTDLTMTIKGPETLLTAFKAWHCILIISKNERKYVPCFSLGCSANKLTIKPLDFDADID